MVPLRVCSVCHTAGVGPKHQCLRRQRSGHAGSSGDAGPARPLQTIEARPVTRWFWSLPFNPSSWQQILAYIEGQGHEPGTHRKTKKPTTDAASLRKLVVETGDPLYQHLLDGRAVEKVDSTYAVGSLTRLDADDRLHPEITPKPATLRDASQDPNLQNVIADKSSKPGLASGFRTCVEARDGIPPDTSAEEVAGWQARWGTA
jgi:hypothetical protein